MRIKVQCVVAIFDAAQQGQQPVAFPADRHVTNSFITQGSTQIIDVTVELLAARGVHVHLHQEVDTTLQIETQRHRLAANGAQPGGRCMRQVQRDDVLLAQRRLDDIGSTAAGLRLN